MCIFASALFVLFVDAKKSVASASCAIGTNLNLVSQGDFNVNVAVTDTNVRPAVQLAAGDTITINTTLTLGDANYTFTATINASPGGVDNGKSSTRTGAGSVTLKATANGDYTIQFELAAGAGNTVQIAVNSTCAAGTGSSNQADTNSFAFDALDGARTPFLLFDVARQSANYEMAFNTGALLPARVRNEEASGALNFAKIEVRNTFDTIFNGDTTEAAFNQIKATEKAYLDAQIKFLTNPDNLGQAFDSSSESQVLVAVIKAYEQFHFHGPPSLDSRISEYINNLDAQANAQIDADIAAENLAEEFRSIVDGQVPVSNPGFNITATDGYFGFQNSAVLDPANQILYWSRGSITWLSGDQSLGGHVFSLQAGATKWMRPDLTVGGHLSFQHGQIDQPSSSAKLTSDGYGVGGFVQTSIGGDLKGMISGFYERSSNTSNINSASGSFNRDYFRLDVQGSRTIQKGVWTIVPSAGIGLVHASTDAYTDSAGANIAATEETTIDGSTRIDFTGNYQVSWKNVTAVRPTFGFGLTTNFKKRSARALSNGNTVEQPSISGVVKIGNTFQLTNGGNLSIDGSIGGIGGTTQTYTGALKFSKSF